MKAAGVSQEILDKQTGKMKQVSKKNTGKGRQYLSLNIIFLKSAVDFFIIKLELTS